MMHRKQKPESTTRPQGPDNLLDLNRSLPNYVYQPEQALTERNIEPPKRTFSWKRLLLGLGVSAGILALLAGGWLGWKILHNELKIFGWKGITSLVNPTKLKGEKAATLLYYWLATRQMIRVTAAPA